ncbi:cytochrome P450 family protein [Phaeacidiphilus oryzae]|uniref:cytochrome P450 family protein n=1 Tax=Phaeacidiphilus oryzae TaxID=348818 RepID=UPI000566A3B1|nr:cytochrome P450 [Phaeacidiphilus oryzae]
MSHPPQDPAEDPYPYFARLRASDPVHPLPDTRHPERPPGYLVTGYQAAREALTCPQVSKDTARFFAGKPSTRDLHPAVSQSMSATDPPRHTRLRKLVTTAFTTGAVAALRPFIAKTTQALLDRCPGEPGVAFDLVAALAMPLPVIVICELLGVPKDDRPSVRHWSAELFAAGAPERVDAASHSLASYLAQLIAARRASPSASLLDRLIAARDGEDRLTEEELLSLAVLLLVAGHETTTAFLGNAVLALLQHPAELDRLRADPDSLPAALEELLRYCSPFTTATFRYAEEPVTLAGRQVPAGSPVLLALGAANRDPDRYPSPDRLDLDRAAAGHLTFGYGIHRCVGAPLARAEAAIALRAVLARFPRLRLAVPADRLVWRSTRLIRGLRTLPVLDG